MENVSLVFFMLKKNAISKKLSAALITNFSVSSTDIKTNKLTAGSSGKCFMQNCNHSRECDYNFPGNF